MDTENRPGRHKGQKASHTDAEDALLWAHVAAEVTPLPGRTRPAKPVFIADSPVRTHGSGLSRAAPTKTQKSAEPGRELDARTRRRFERGGMPIEAVLDLHGYGQMDAREALHGFLAQAWARAARCVLVITGKGLRNEGVLRTRLPEWLADGAVRRMVLAHAPARAHGGAGAFYILLRRRRECGP